MSRVASASESFLQLMQCFLEPIPMNTQVNVRDNRVCTELYKCKDDDETRQNRRMQTNYIHTHVEKLCN